MNRRFICGVLLVVVSVTTISQGERFVFSATPITISPGVTPELTVRCGLEDDGNSGVSRVNSIIIRTVDGSVQKEVARIAYSQAAKGGFSTERASVTGDLSNKAGYLQITWPSPIHGLAGQYNCDIAALATVGDIVTFKSSMRVISTGFRQCYELVDIVFLVDESSSIGAVNFKLLQTFLANVTQHFKVGSNGARFAGVQFATQVKKLFDLNKYSSSKDISSALLGTPYGQGSTYTHLGLNYIADNKLFSAASGGRSNAPDVVIVFTDGESTMPEQTKQAADRLKQQGATVVSVGVGGQFKTSELFDIASSKDAVFVVSDFNLLYYIENNLTARVCPSTRS
uniref:Mucus protein n=1 Tax=Cornu aspersum TaxID=6535 RepID=A0A6B7KKA8_CORAP|nr:mucus protein [Cornu aspersum]QEG59313.1 mucus protein [Cornu aspersum]